MPVPTAIQNKGRGRRPAAMPARPYQNRTRSILMRLLRENGGQYTWESPGGFTMNALEAMERDGLIERITDADGNGAAGAGAGFAYRIDERGGGTRNRRVTTATVHIVGAGGTQRTFRRVNAAGLQALAALQEQGLLTESKATIAGDIVYKMTTSGKRGK